MVENCECSVFIKRVALLAAAGNEEKSNHPGQRVKLCMKYLHNFNYEKIKMDNMLATHNYNIEHLK
jgi:hypothetical protein